MPLSAEGEKLVLDVAMPFDDLSKDELVKILELIEHAAKCSDSLRLRSLILEARVLFGADYSACGLIKPGQPMITAYVNGNYPEEWVKRYLEGNSQVDDPVVRFHCRYAMTELWKDVFRQYDDPGVGKVLKDAGDYGIKYGVTGAVYMPEEEQIAVFAFSGAADRFRARHKKILDILTLHFNRALVRSVRAPGIVDPLLITDHLELREGRG